MTRKCEICGKELKALRITKRYCGVQKDRESCTAEAQRRNWREWRLQNLDYVKSRYKI